uniref:FGENESH: predicted gene_10.18 protein n=1 Tax=Rhodotorula toruloides TaxID=5286 RepID=A0A0K3CLL0_RHOTO
MSPSHSPRYLRLASSPLSISLKKPESRSLLSFLDIKRPNHSILDQSTSLLRPSSLPPFPIALLPLTLSPVAAAEDYLPQVRYPYNIPSNHSHPNALTNLDGFGMGWYALSPPSEEKERKEGLEPEVYHSLVKPAWEDEEVRRICEGVRSSVVFGHVRAGGNRIEANCHPFSFGPFLFMHNGFVTGPFPSSPSYICQADETARIGAGFSKDPQRLERLISPAARKAVRGTTDSARVFALFLTFLDPHNTGSFSRPLPRSALISALIRVVSLLYHLYRPAGGWSRSRTHWNSLNLALSSGSDFVCMRYATPGREAPSLYWSTQAGVRMDARYEGEPDGGEREGGGGRGREEKAPHVVVASEPMTQGRDEDWHLLQSGEILDTNMDELHAQYHLHEQHKLRNPYAKWTWKPRIRTVEQVRAEIGDVGVRKRKRTSSVSSLD